MMRILARNRLASEFVAMLGEGVYLGSTATAARSGDRVGPATPQAQFLDGCQITLRLVPERTTRRIGCIMIRPLPCCTGATGKCAAI
jgi:hypothetical protein